MLQEEPHAGLGRLKPTPNPGLTPNPSPKGEGNIKGEGEY